MKFLAAASKVAVQLKGTSGDVDFAAMNSDRTRAAYLSLTVCACQSAFSPQRLPKGAHCPKCGGTGRMAA